jgi:hypothetical protein
MYRQSEIIDLTNSDDEDEIPSQTRLPLNPPIATQLHLYELSPSNHGLILPGTFDRIRPTSTEHMSVKSNVVLSNCPSEQPPRTSPLIHAQSALQAPANNRRSTNQSFIVVGQENGVKRRRTHGGFISQTLPSATVSTLPQRALASAQRMYVEPQSIWHSLIDPQPRNPSKPNPAPILPPMPQRALIHSKSHIQEATSHSPSPPSPAPQPRSKPAVATSSKVTTVRMSPLPDTETEIRNRRVSSDGRIQKPRSVSGGVGGGEEERMDYVLRYQVSPHIKNAVARYSNSLSHEEKEDIWKKVHASPSGVAPYADYNLDHFQVN